MSQDAERVISAERAKPKPTRRLSVRSLMLLVACIGAMLWAYRYLSENYDAELVASRVVQKESILALRTGTKAERLRALETLRRLVKADTHVVMRAFTEALESQAPEVRVTAAESLSWITDSAPRSWPGSEAIPLTVASLIRCLKDSDPAMRVAAVKALDAIARGLLRERATEKSFQDATTALVARLKDPETVVRAAAAANVGAIASAGRGRTTLPANQLQSLMRVMAEALDDRETRVRRAAIDALVVWQGRSTEPPALLMKGLYDQTIENRIAAVRGLNRYSQGLDAWAPRLFQILEENSDPRLQRVCSNTLDYAFKPPAITPALIPFLITSLGSQSLRVRSHSALFLGDFGKAAAEAVPALVQVLNEPLDPKAASVIGPATSIFDPGCAAALSLGKITPFTENANRAIVALTEVARSGPISRRGWAASALGGYGRDAVRAVPVLIEVIKEAAPEGTFEREPSAARALGQIAPNTPSADSAVKALIPLLQSNDSRTRQKAAEALGRFGPKAAAAIPGLRDLAKSLSPEERDVAAKALFAID